MEERVKRLKIGTMTLKEARDMQKSYEVAAWSKTVHVEPQTVDVFAEVEDGKVVDTSLGWAYTGVVKDAHFPALFGGVAYSDGERPEDIGKEESIHVSPYAHAVALRLLGEATSEGLDGLQLDVEPLYVPFRSGDRGSYSAGLFVEPSEEQRERSRGVAAALRGEPIPHDSPQATFGWAMAKKAEARRQIEEAERTQEMADYALRQYAPELAKPELATLDAPEPADEAEARLGR